MIKAAGRMGWSERDFYLSTPAFFFTAYEGFAEQQQLEWERARYVAFHALQPLKAHAKNWKVNRLTDMGLFPWEAAKAKANVPQLTPEERERISRELDDMLAKQYNIQVITPEA